MNPVHPPLEAPWLRLWLRLGGAILAALSLAVIAGRFTGQLWLVRLVPGGTPMAFSTALGFLLVGAGFASLAADRVRHTRLLGWATLLLGGGTLLVYSGAEFFGVRALAYDPRRSVEVVAQGFRGRMSLNTAVLMGATGFALITMTERRVRVRLLVLVASVLLALATLGLVGYITGLRGSEVWWRYTGMAVPTSAGFIVAASLILAWVARHAPPERQVDARTLPFFAAASTTLLVLGITLVVSRDQQRDASEAVGHALEVKTQLAVLDAAVVRVVPGRPETVAELTGAIRAFLQLTGGDAERADLTRGVRTSVGRLQFAALREGGDAELAASQEATRAAIARMIASESDVVASGRVTAALSDRRLRNVLLTGVALTIGFLSGAYLFVGRAQRRLQRSNEDLESRVRARTSEWLASTSQLRESERRLRFLADTMPQLVWTARPDGTTESINRGWRSYLGIGDQVAPAAALTDVTHNEDRATLRGEWNAMLTESRPAGGEARVRRADGEYRWHLWRSHPERDDAGRLVRWVATATDIHERKLAAVALEQRVAERTAELATSEERFRQAFEFAGIGMAIIGLDGRWVRVNPAVCEIVGYPQGELLDKTFQEITHPDDVQADVTHVAELLAGRRRSYQMEKRYFHRAGHPVWVRLTASLVRDGAGAPVHFVSQIEDITGRKQLEASLASARDQALEASRLKSEFLATMSHEIRTPMNGVIGMTSLLRDTPLTATQADYVRTIESSGESLLAIINDILDYSKIEAGRIDLEVAPFDLRLCLEDALDLFAAKALEKNIELVYLMGPTVPAQVAGDVTRLRQILVNLLGNALKFTERGEVVVTVDAELHEHRDQLHFAVQDTGIGIAPEGMERLFKSFSQVDASTTRRFGGTGLGLAISHRLAALMGGAMWAESRVGEGSTFHFTVRLAATPQFVRHNFQVVHPELSGRTLLVVDDHAINRRVVAGLAGAWGLQVREAAGPGAAIAALTRDPRCDVAVLDMHMPDMDGEQLAAAVHQLPGCERLPLVLLTSLGRRARSPEFARTLTKPVKADALFTALRACVHPGPGPAARAVATGAPTAPGGEFAQRYPLRLLVAEDNAVNQRVVKLLLQRVGYHATVVANGLEAVTALELADHDVILMDLEMPELDGYAATQRIRAARTNPGRPWIVALTANAMQGDRERALAAGMNDFLTKPLRPEALAEALVRAHAAVVVRK